MQLVFPSIEFIIRSVWYEPQDLPEDETLGIIKSVDWPPASVISEDSSLGFELQIGTV